MVETLDEKLGEMASSWESLSVGIYTKPYTPGKSTGRRYKGCSYDQ